MANVKIQSDINKRDDSMYCDCQGISYEHLNILFQWEIKSDPIFYMTYFHERRIFEAGT